MNIKSITVCHRGTETQRNVIICFCSSLCALCLRGKFEKLLKDEYGHTLIEALVAMALFAAVVLPIGRLFTTMVMTGGSGNKVTALMLGKQEMETCLGQRDYTGTEKELLTNGKMWQVTRVVRNDGGIAIIAVDVFRKGDKTSLISLKTARVAE